MKKIIITGATSFIGRFIVISFIKNGWVVYAICRKNSVNLDKLPITSNLHIVYSDFSNLECICAEIKEADVFLNLAWAGTSQKNRDEISVHENNVKNSLAAIRISKKLNCKYFFETGSQAELGVCSSKQYETTECNPFSEYGKSKVRILREGMSISEELGIKYIHLRIFSVYGPGDHDYTLVSTCLDKMEKNLAVDLSECTQKWNFLYVEDAGNVIYKTIESCIEKNTPSSIINIASKDTRQLKSFIEEMLEITNSKSCLNYGAKIPQNIVSLDPDIKILEGHIGNFDFTSFHDGILKTIGGVEYER